MADAGYLTIGKVVRRLQNQYPDLSVSKVRYLEDEGLLTPSRTPGGYRLYSSRDIQRLENILYLQKSRFLPLSVIKQELDGRPLADGRTPTDARIPTDAHVPADARTPADSGAEGSGSSVSAQDRQNAFPAEKGMDARLRFGHGGEVGLGDPTLAVDSAAERELHPLERMPDDFGVPIALVRKLSDCGLLRLVRSPAGRELVDGRDLRLIRTCAELARYGIEPKNLRQYVSAANREVPMFEQALSSISRHPGESPQDRHLRRERALERMLALTGEVRSALLRRSLSDEAPGGSMS